MSEVIVNWWGVLGAAVAANVIGFLWYGPVFGKVWMRLSGHSSESMKKGSAGASYFWMFVGTVVTAYVLAHVLSYSGALSWQDAAQGALWMWLGFVAPVLAGIVLWDGKPFKLYLLNVGYYLVSLQAMACILIRWG